MRENFFASNMRHLRKSLKDKNVQNNLATAFGVKPSTYGAYEEGRAIPKLDKLTEIAKFYGLLLDELLFVDLGKVKVIGSSGNGARVLVATVDSESRDNIELVPVKAAAGYTKGYGDPGFIQTLPTFSLPFLDQNRKHRAFQIEGDSMPPAPSGSYVFGHYIDDWQELKDESLAIIVTQDEGIVFKRVYNYLDGKGSLVLASTNPLYKPYPLAQEDILEVWGFEGFFAKEF